VNLFRGLCVALCLLLAGCGRAADGPARTEVVGPHRLAVDVYLPEGDTPAHGRRAVLMVHGGGWGAGDRTELRDLARLAAREGVVALSMDYRLTSQDGVHWPMPADDVATVLAWTRAHADALGIDPRRIALLGGSAGGHLAAWIARDPDPAKRPARLIVLWGPWDLHAMSSDAPAWVPQSVAALLAGQPAEAASPLAHLVRGMPPTLIVHGTDDPLVPIDQSRRACAALQALGNACTLLELPGQGHAPDDPAQVQRAMAAVREALAAL
jgi:acetyl esterase